MDYFEKLQIKAQWMKYCKIITKIPELNYIEEIPENSENQDTIAYFSLNNLYNKKYILFVNPQLFENDTPALYIEQVLFHEFTHLNDSLKFVKYDEKDFWKLMAGYSEVHASEIEMDRILNTQKDRGYSLDYPVVCRHVYMLRTIIDDALNKLINDFSYKYNAETLITKMFYFDSVRLFYFIGYMKSLRSHGLDYDWNYDKIQEPFRDLFYEITIRWFEDSITDEYILSYMNQISDIMHHERDKCIEIINSGNGEAEK
jgi:hypothetical protein|nr:MAG TPA: Protein of unknown function DUF45 [Caudoviricetes sp.]